METPNAGRTGRGVPTARSVDHVGFTVPDLDEAVRFFVHVLGCDLLYRTRGFSDPVGDWMTRHYGAHPRARLETAMLRCGPGANLELLAWGSPGPTPSPPRQFVAIGAAHLAIYVDDLRGAVAYLGAQPGVQVLGTRTVVTGESNEGTEFVFVRLPWGMCLELVRWPPLMPYCTSTVARLHAPAAAWREVGVAGEGPQEA
jgi:catechol 2,3-dioxygenase-like lactoylglutathione lyase family enzyme